MEHIFGAGGGDRIAQEYQTPLLGSLPLDSRIREHVGNGTPTVIADPIGKIAASYREIARSLAAQLSRLPVSNSIPGIVQVKDA
jgi:ATP-binding protein involved in chromosome partitioning